MWFEHLIRLALAAVLVSSAAAHDIPTEVTAHMIAKPEGDRLKLLVRVPLSSMRDVVFPAQPNGFLDMESVEPKLQEVAGQWIVDYVELFEGGEELPEPRIAAMQISLPSDKSFATYEEAMARVQAPRPTNADNLSWDQVLFDVWLEYPIGSEDSEFEIRPGLEHLAARVLMVLRFLPSDGSVRAFQLQGDPGVVPLDPSWGQAAWRFVELGFIPILDGPDHLLFLACLVIPFHRLRSLVVIVTAFTLAHSITLIGSAFNLGPEASLFPPLIETLIAASIVYMALENIIGVTTAQRRWMFAFGFGLIHGFGCAFALREALQFAGTHLLTSLLSFNVGVELGQLLVLVVLVPVLQALFRYGVAERMGTIILSALVAHTGWHWMLERLEQLTQYSFDPTTADLASAVRTVMWLVIGSTGFWVASVVVKKRRAARLRYDSG